LDARALACPNCGAPLPRHARWTAVTCTHCGASTAPGFAVISRKEFRDALARADREVQPRPDDVFVSGIRYRVLGTLARGERADLSLAERARRLTERVVLKVFRSATDADAAAREWEALSALSASEARGAAHFSMRLPAPIARGTTRVPGGPERPCVVTRALPGFRWNLEDVRKAFPGGLDARHAVWMWRRLLELLGWVHESGWVHGAVVPQHVVLNEREHGATLVSWSHAARKANGTGAMEDIVMAARAIDSLLGPTEPVPAPLRSLLEECLAGAAGTEDAWVLKERVADAAAQAFGPPMFVPFHMPSLDRS
jgi:hypothetical protein